MGFSPDNYFYMIIWSLELFKRFKTKHLQFSNQLNKRGWCYKTFSASLPNPLAAISVANRTAFCLRQNWLYVSTLFNWFMAPCKANTVTPGLSRRKISWINFTYEAIQGFVIMKKNYIHYWKSFIQMKIWLPL